MAINAWNSLPLQAKNKPSVKAFKSFLKKKEKSKRNLLYYFGNRKIGIHHARIRMGCSLLNSHLSKILHVIEDPSCKCGFNIESPRHYFLECPIYAGTPITKVIG